MAEIKNLVMPKAPVGHAPRHAARRRAQRPLPFPSAGL